MNWEEISKKHPEALNELVKWSSLRESKHQETWLSPYRAFYDFFDEQEIYVAITTLLKPHTDDSTRFFEWDIDIEYDTFMDYELYNTRQEAEEMAFLKAFKILEEKLK